jgi:uncharacterized protein (TIGR00299 family) protein
MKIAYFDAFSGIAGDMTVGALVDAGCPGEALVDSLNSLGTGAVLSFEKTKRRGIAASKFRVQAEDTKKHRHLHHIIDMIDRAALNDRVKRDAKAVFQRLGEAEASVHGTPVEKVHFHEVGAVDSICDIIGACFAIDALGIDAIHCSAVNVGSGTVKAEHGVMPVPAPATAALLKGIPIYSRGPEVELTTPTGAAFVAALSSSFGALPPMRMLANGYGAGDRDFPEHANVLRVLIGETTNAPESTTVSVIEANIDDSTPEVLGYAMERLMEEGALDVTLTPLLMKKNRPGTLLRVIARTEDREMLAGLVMTETSTLGLRLYSAERRVQKREIVTVMTSHGDVRVKVTDGGCAPEYEDCRRIAREKGVPLRQILSEASFAYFKSIR